MSMVSILRGVLVYGLVLSAAFQSPEANQQYQRGREALDRGKWQEAIQAFELAAKDEALADAALYWQAYANAKIPSAARALELIASLETRFPRSSYRDDAQALAAEIRGASRGAASSGDEELKLMALNGLMQADEAEAIPILEELLAGNGSSRLKERALFVLAQSDSDEAHQILARFARGEKDPELQREAIRYLGVHGSDRGLALLADLYRSLTAEEAKAAVLESFMIAGEQERLLELAKSEPDPELRGRAIQLLGTMDASAELWELYQRESSEVMKKRLLQAFMVGGDEEHLLEVARDKSQSEELRSSAIQLLGAQGATEALWQIYRDAPSLEVKKQVLHGLFVAGEHEKIAEVARDPKEPLELRKAAIHNLGTTGEEAAPALVELYRSETSTELKKQVLHALFIQDASSELVAIARAETNLELRKQAVHWISLLGSKEAKEFLKELLKK
jgi:hypothetical protein